MQWDITDTVISIHALLAESDLAVADLSKRDVRFLSTLSLRRATYNDNFDWWPLYISIHALLAESDAVSTAPWIPPQISIHALLAESDDTM